MGMDDISDARDLSNELLPVLTALCRMETELSSLEQDDRVIDEAVDDLEDFILGCEDQEYSSTVTVWLKGDPPGRAVKVHIEVAYLLEED